MFKKPVLVLAALAVLALPMPAARADDKQSAMHVLAGITVHSSKCPTPQTRAIKDFADYLRDQGPFEEREMARVMYKVFAQIDKVGLSRWCSGMDLMFTTLKR